jgi:hypothetical protein
MAKDVETLILNESYSPVQIKIIWLFIFLFSAVLGNLITGWLQKDNINYNKLIILCYLTTIKAVFAFL